MADYATTLAAVDQLLGTTGLERYAGAEARLAAEALTGDRFVSLAAEVLPAGAWTGTAGELLALVTPDKPPKGWPSTARAVTQRLHRQAPVMRKAGWTVRDRYDAHRKLTVWTLETPRESPPQDPQDPQPAGYAGMAGNDPEEFLGTCRGCGDPLTVVEPGQTTHPGCEVA